MMRYMPTGDLITLIRNQCSETRLPREPFCQVDKNSINDEMIPLKSKNSRKYNNKKSTYEHLPPITALKNSNKDASNTFSTFIMLRPSARVRTSPRRSRLGSASVEEYRAALTRSCQEEDVLIIPVVQKLVPDPGRTQEEVVNSEWGMEDVFGYCASSPPPVIQVGYDDEHPVGVICKSFYVEYALINAIFATLPSFRTISTLKIEDCCISSDVVCILSTLLLDSPIVDLSLDGNTGIARELPLLIRTNLLYLSLRRCSLNDEDVIKISKELIYDSERAQKLLVLNLNMNCFGDEAVLVLAQALRSNRTLISLSLCGNRITDEGARYLAEVICRFPLTDEEIMIRRRRNFDRLLKRKSILCKAIDDWRSQVEAEKLKNNERKAEGIASKRTKSIETGLRRPSTSSRDKKRGMTPREKIRGGRRKSEGRESSTLSTGPTPAEMKDMMLRVDSEMTVDSHPFVAEVMVQEGKLFCHGCWRLGSLNLSYNRITDYSVVKFLEAVCYQDEVFNNPRRGLFRLIIQPGNLIPRDSNLAKIECFLKARCRKENPSDLALSSPHHQERRISTPKK